MTDQICTCGHEDSDGRGDVLRCPVHGIGAEYDGPAPTWQCEYCGRFYSERTAAAHGWCQQEQDRKDAESAWPA